MYMALKSLAQKKGDLVEGYQYTIDKILERISQLLKKMIMA